MKKTLSRLLAFLVLAVPVWSQTSDFATRCAAPGVVNCIGFDSAADVPRGTVLSAAADGVYRGTIDTTTKVSGAGSLLFTVPNNITPAANMAGWWDGPLGGSFGQNSTFYVQFQQRFSPEMLSNESAWKASDGSITYWKQADFHGHSSTCQNVELSTVNNYGQGFPSMYGDCGSLNLDANVWNASNPDSWNNNITPFNIEQGGSATDGYNCAYGSRVAGTGNGTGCFMYPSNTWITFYYEIAIGTWGSANSAIQAWVATNGGPYQQWMNIKNVPLASGGDNYDTLFLGPYMTGLATSAPAPAFTWYDELIVSTQPIKAPGGSVIPPPLVTQLNATANVPGTFVYTPPAGTVLAAGTQTLSVTFNPTDNADYSPASATTQLTVTGKTIPTIAWNAPAAITFGTPLAAAQLDATSVTPGVWTYSPVIGTVLKAGAAQVLTVTLTPTDASFGIATASTTITVNKAVPALSWAVPAPITVGTPLQ